MTSRGSEQRGPRTVKELVDRLRAGVDACERARQDPEVQAKAAAEYEGRIVPLEQALTPEQLREHRERDWTAREIPRRVWRMLHDGAPPPPGTPPEAATCGPDAPKPWPALEAVGRFLQPEQPKTILVLTGPVDTGKTVAAAWGVAWSGGRFAKGIDLLRAGLYPDDPKFWQRLFAAKVLAVDDLGVEPLDSKGFGLAAIEDLVDRRYDGGRKTIITTNAPPVVFRDRFGERIWRRIAEVGIVVGLVPARRFFGQPKDPGGQA